MHLTLAATHFGVQQTVLNLNDVAQNTKRSYIPL